MRDDEEIGQQLESPANARLSQFLLTQPFELDPYQLEAIAHLQRGASVLVSAPTGAGKTVVAEFAVFEARQRTRRCIYTTPLKALSNQKFRDLLAQIGSEVGLLTGDVVINANAPVLIMTTEILRNILQSDPQRLEDVSHVILDEAHYLGIEGRGTVWEETIVFLGKDTQVVALSATIPNAEELATWVSEVHRPMAVVFHQQRPVPLEPHVALPEVSRLFDGRGRLAVRAFRIDGWVDIPDPVAVVRSMQIKKMLPAIYFVFSRIGCEQHAQRVIAADLGLNTDSERHEIDARVQDAIRQTPSLMGSPSTAKWLSEVLGGVAPHHAGLLPPLKLLIEKLFQRGLIKVVFATETLSAGINMPARSVVLSNLVKRTDDGMRMLTVSEFQQMTGRAGRRGMDEVGHAVVLASHRYSPHDIVHLVRDKVEPLRSRFTLNFNMVANLLARYDWPTAKRIVEMSFAAYQSDAFVAHLVHRCQELRDEQPPAEALCPVVRIEPRSALLERHRQVKRRRESLRKRKAALGTPHRFMTREKAVNAIMEAPVGTWVVAHQPGRSRPDLAVLLAKQKTKSGDAHFTILTDLPALVRLGSAHLVGILPADPVAELPGGDVMAKAAEMSFLQHLKPNSYRPDFDRWRLDSQIDSAAFEWALRDSPEVITLQTKIDAVSAEWRDIPCTTCRIKRQCETIVAKHHSQAVELAGLERQIDEARTVHWREFEAMHRLMEAAGYMKGRELLARGVAVANLRTTNELMAAECVAGGFFEGLSPVAMATLVSCLVAEPSRGRQTWQPLPFGDAVFRITREIAMVGRGLVKLQRKFGLEQPIYLECEYAGLTQAWADGTEWSAAVNVSGIAEGQLVRHLRQVIDMLQQLRELPGVNDSFHDRAQSAISLLDRDIVREVF